MGKAPVGVAKLGKKYGVDMPIVEQVNAVLFEGKDAAEAVNDLMMRSGKPEHTAKPWS